MKIKYIIALSALLLAGYFGFRTYQVRTDPLIAGIPPHENADGTVDFVLFDRFRANKKTAKFIIRVPNALGAKLWDPTSIKTSGDVAATFTVRPNSTLELRLTYPDLKRASEELTDGSIQSGSDLIITLLEADRFRPLDSDFILQNCVETGKRFGSFVEYTYKSKPNPVDYCPVSSNVRRQVFVSSRVNGSNIVVTCNQSILNKTYANCRSNYGASPLNRNLRRS